MLWAQYMQRLISIHGTRTSVLEVSSIQRYNTWPPPSMSWMTIWSTSTSTIFEGMSVCGRSVRLAVSNPSKETPSTLKVIWTESKGDAGPTSTLVLPMKKSSLGAANYIGDGFKYLACSHISDHRSHSLCCCSLGVSKYRTAVLGVILPHTWLLEQPCYVGDLASPKVSSPYIASMQRRLS